MKRLFTLETERVLLEPLTLTNFENLTSIASQEGLVQYSPTDIATTKTLRTYVETALMQSEQGTSIPFILYDKKNDAYAGCTRYMNIDHKNKVLHIGATWIGHEFQGSGLNSHMKYAMLEHAFGPMAFEKVEFRIDERNAKSRKAVEKLGATLEGILRKNVYMLDGYKRNTCCYGLLPEEWKAIRRSTFKNYSSTFGTAS